MPYLFAKQEETPTTGAGYRSLFEESEEERRAREAQERLRAFQERYPGAMTGINEELLQGPEKPVHGQDPTREVDQSLSGFVTLPSGEGGVKEGLGRAAESVAGLLDLPALVGSILAGPPPEAYLGAQIAGDPITPEREARMRAGGAELAESVSVPPPARTAREMVRANYERIKEDEVAKGVEAGKSPLRIATEDTIKEAVTLALDPLNWVGAGGAAKAGRVVAREGGEAAGRAAAREVAEEVVASAPRVASHAGQAGESPEAIARVARGERYYRVSPGGEVTPIPNTVDAVDMRVNPGEAKVRVTSRGAIEVDQRGRGGPAQSAAIDRLRRGEVPPPPRELPEPQTYELDAGEGLPSEAPSLASREAGFIRVGPDPKPRTPQDEVLEEFDSAYFDRSDRKEPLGDRLVGIGRRIRDEMEDELQPVVRAVREGGDPVQVREMEEMLQQVRAAPTRSEVPVVRHTTAFDPATGDEVVTGGPLLAVLRGHDEGVLLDAERYMAAQRNLELAERAARGAPVKVSEESVAASRSAVEAVRQKYGERISEIDEIASGYRDWAQRAQIDPLVRVGVYTPEEARRMVEENTLYAIYDRVDRDLRALGIDLSDESAPLLPGGKPRTPGGGGPRAGSPTRRIHGGLDEDGKIQGIFESSALQAMRVQKFVDRQQVRNMLGRLGDEVDEIPIQRLTRRQVPVARVLDEATGEAGTIFRAQERGGATFVRYEDGQRIEYAAPTDVLDALGRLTPAQASTALAPARFATQALRVGAVENPSFAAFNAIRDAFLAPIFSRHGMIPGYDVARTAGKEALRRVRGQGPSEAWQVAEEFGGFATMMDVDRVSMRRAMARARTLTESGGGGRAFLAEWARNPLLPFHVVGASLERLNRATEAALALRGGRRTFLKLPVPGTLGKAGKKAATRRSVGLDAADITLNFMRGGRVGKVWNRYEAFSNAMLQDVSKFSREMKADPFGVTTRAMAFVGVPSIINYLMNRDDPDYQELPEWEKALFYHPKKLDNGWWVRAPRPLGLVSTFFGYGSHKAAEALYEEDPKAAGEFLDELVRTTPAEFLARPTNLLPNAAQPTAEAQNNYSQFLDRPIVPEYQRDWPAEEQYGEHTSRTMVDLGQALEVSPRLAQYVFESHTGTLGRESLALLDRLRAEPDNRQAQDAKDIPILGRFLTRPAEGFSSQSVQEFYDLTDEAMGARSSVLSGGASVGDQPAARMGLKASRARRRMGDLADRLSSIQASPNLSEESKRERLRKVRQEMTELAQGYIKEHARSIP